jgi:hypothetical protein
LTRGKYVTANGPALDDVARTRMLTQLRGR